jgi:hypothetical protein
MYVCVPSPARVLARSGVRVPPVRPPASTLNIPSFLAGGCTSPAVLRRGRRGIQRA